MSSGMNNGDNVPPTVSQRGATLCIFCRNCTGGCSWSKDFTQVEGWYAKEKRNEKGEILRAWIGWCPEFRADNGLYEFVISDKAEQNRTVLSQNYFYVSKLRLAVLRYHFLNNYKGDMKCWR